MGKNNRNKSKRARRKLILIKRGDHKGYDYLELDVSDYLSSDDLSSITHR